VGSAADFILGVGVSTRHAALENTGPYSHTGGSWGRAHARSFDEQLKRESGLAETKSCFPRRS
jgi:hypothetical protein